MPGEMRAAINKFFTPREKLGHFLKKLMVYCFSVLTIVDPLKGGECLKHIMLNLTKSLFGGLNVCDHLLIGIRCEKHITCNKM